MLPPHGLGYIIASAAVVARALRSPGEAARLRRKAQRAHTALGRIVLQRHRAQAARPA